MFTVYCQQSFCTWKAKFLISLPWPVCQLARQDWPSPFSQSWRFTGGSSAWSQEVPGAPSPLHAQGAQRGGLGGGGHVEAPAMCYR